MARAIGKNEEEVAVVMMSQIRDRCNPIEPPAISSDGNDSYPEAMLEIWGKLPEYTGRGRPPTHKQPQPRWKCLQVTKHRSGSRLIGVTHDALRLRSHNRPGSTAPGFSRSSGLRPGDRRWP